MVAENAGDSLSRDTHWAGRPHHRTGAERPRPCATRLHYDRRAAISRLVAHGRAPSDQPV